MIRSAHRPSHALPLRGRAFLLAIAVGLSGLAQDTWRLDSLMGTWYVQRTVQDKNIPFSRHFGPDTTEVRTEWTATSEVLPDLYNPEVARAIDLYGGRYRTQFRLMLGMYAVLRPMIVLQLQAAELPEELADLPMALSAMNVQCRSDRGEGGLWMLPWPVAVRYGLTVSAEVDERRHEVKSTAAACRYLKDLHAEHRDWPMTVLAYLAGPAQLNAARIRSGGATTVEGLYPHLDPAYRDLVPTLIAMHWLAHEASGPAPRPIAFLPWEPVDTLHCPVPVRFASVARNTRLSLSHLRALNPELVGALVPTDLPLYLPQRTRFDFPALVDSLLAAERATHPAPAADTTEVDSTDRTAPPGTTTLYYRVKSGDALGGIAQRHGVTVKQLQEWNELKSDVIDVGEELVIHKAAARPAAKSASTGDRTYVVRSGDTLDGIAKRYRGVSAQDIMRANGISHRIRPGQRLRIPLP